MSRPRRQIYTMAQYLENISEGYISNDVDTQRNPAWKPIIDGLVVTILTDDYIPSIILAEEPSGQKKVVDGGSRTASFMMFRYGNYKVKSSVENPIIKYKRRINVNGKMSWEDAEFDIRKKTYSQFPKELQKAFDEYQVETVIHECDADGIAMYLRRYNVHTSMNPNQKMFIYLPKFAGIIRKITNSSFFTNNSSFTESEKEKGALERVIAESAMCTFHLNKWKTGKPMAEYLNNNGTYEEFEKINDNVLRLEKIISNDLKDIFNSKDSFIWLSVFNSFVELGLEDNKFSDFLKAFKNGLKNKKINGQVFENVDKDTGTKDKKIVSTKLHILKTLMYEYFDINTDDLENSRVIDFVKKNVSKEITDEDVEEYKEMLDLYIKVDAPINKEENHPSLIAMVAFACMNDTDVELEQWFSTFVKENKTYIKYQKNNFLHMKTDFIKYLESLGRGK